MESFNLSSYLPYIFILMGVLAMLVSLFSGNRTEKLAKTGERCKGIIFKLERKSETGFNTIDSTLKNKITVRFVTQKQEWITEDLNTDSMLTWTGQFEEGQTVEVIYDPNNPTDFTIETNQSPLLVKVIFALAGLAFLAIGIYKLLPAPIA
jgi:hypothetical protein